MAFNDKTYEQIHRYLEGEMSASEQQAFEQKIASNEALASEVILQRDIAEALADTPENALRQNLQTLSNQYEDASSNGRSWRSFIWLLPLFLVVGIWFFSTSSDEKVEEVPTTLTKETPNLPTENSSTSLEIDTSSIERIVPQQPEEKKIQTLDNQKSKNQKIPKEDSVKTPVYADKTKPAANNTPIEPPMIMAAPSLLNHDFFASLPLLDSLIAQNFQSKNFQIKIQQALPDTLTLEEEQKSNYAFLAELSIARSLSSVSLYLYPNHAFYWKENHPWDFTTAKINEIEKSTYQIQLTPNLNLEPGLYYYALRASKEGEVFFVGKFVVVE
ncbi:MAG: hypothetical protein AAGG68_01585 [Bacteroidota bacterium]